MIIEKDFMVADRKCKLILRTYKDSLVKGSKYELRVNMDDFYDISSWWDGKNYILITPNLYSLIMPNMLEIKRTFLQLIFHND